MLYLYFIIISYKAHWEASHQAKHHTDNGAKSNLQAHPGIAQETWHKNSQTSKANRHQARQYRSLTIGQLAKVTRDPQQAQPHTKQQAQLGNTKEPWP